MHAPTPASVAALLRSLAIDPDRRAVVVLAAVVAVRVHVVAGIAAGLALALGLRLSKGGAPWEPAERDRAVDGPLAPVIDLAAFARARRPRPRVVPTVSVGRAARR